MLGLEDEGVPSFPKEPKDGIIEADVTLLVLYIDDIVLTVSLTKLL